MVRFEHYEIAAINRVHHRVGHMTEVGRYRYAPAVRRDRRVAAALRGVMRRCKGLHIYTRRLRAVFAYLACGELAIEYAHGVERPERASRRVDINISAARKDPQPVYVVGVLVGDENCADAVRRYADIFERTGYSFCADSRVDEYAAVGSAYVYAVAAARREERTEFCHVLLL